MPPPAARTKRRLTIALSALPELSVWARQLPPAGRTAWRPICDTTTLEVSAELKHKALLVHERLCAAYECPIPYFHDLDPLSELVSSLLSHRTRNADSGRAFKALRARWPDWQAVRDAPAAEVQETIAGVTWPEQKAPRIQAVLRRLTELRSETLDLGFLAD